MYSAAMPLGPDHSSLARKHAARWADPQARVEVARQMYALRLGELPPQRDLDSLRGFEGQRARHMYRLMADRFSIPWEGRRYDRQRPETSDQINQAINHAAVATRACAQVAVAAVGAIPQLGFIHEDSGISFPLDIADLYRDTVVLPAAFGAVAAFRKNPALEPLERAARRISGELLHDNKIVPEMIDAIKSLLHADDPGGDP
jgi:CRISPR-associated protein Cas1